MNELRTFYIQSPPAGKVFVDDYVHPQCTVIGTTQATSYSLACDFFFGPDR